MTGNVVIPEGAPSGRLHILVERVDYADAAALVVASAHVRISGPMQLHRETFAIAVPVPDPRGRYTVRAHLAVSEHAGVQRGDYISTRSYPVLTREHEQHVEITLSPTS